MGRVTPSAVKGVLQRGADISFTASAFMAYCSSQKQSSQQSHVQTTAAGKQQPDMFVVWPACRWNNKDQQRP
jgi:hypothetical protein